MKPLTHSLSFPYQLIYMAVWSIGIIFHPEPILAQVDACGAVGWATQNGGVTGGGSATPTVATTYTELKSAITNTSVKVVHISGTIEIPSGGRISFQDQSGKTVIGLPGSQLYSNDLTQANSGIIYVKRCSNIIFRNVRFFGPAAYDTDGWDNMTIDNSTNIWVDHCEFYDGLDGNLDIKNAADYVSITWTKFGYLKAPIPGGPGGSNDHRFSDLIGSSDTETQDAGKLRITFQYNWWSEGCVERMPRVRFGQLHIVNNLYNSSVSKYCILAGFEADLLIENNAFIGVKTPIDISQANFVGVTARNNIFSGTTGNTLGSGTSFTPPYSLSIADASVLNTTNFKNCVGATLSAPPTLSCPCISVLPVNLIAFDLTPRQQNMDFILDWKLSNPQSIHQINIEVSGNGTDFKSLATLSTEITNHVITKEELPNNNEVLYVRLKFLEKSGAISYSTIKSASIPKNELVYPNPAQDNVNIIGWSNATMVIYSMEGQILFEAVITAKKNVDVSCLKAGSYIMSITSPNKDEIKRIPFYIF